MAKKSSVERSEDTVLKRAAEIISERLAAGREVRVPGFGAFRLSTIDVVLDHPMDEDYGSGEIVLQDKVTFRPFGRLKEVVKRRRKKCPGKNRFHKDGTRAYLSSCHHKDGEGHEGACVNYKGIEITKSLVVEGKQHG